MAETRTAAFFDLDETVVARSSTLAFGRTMYRAGLLPRSAMVKGAYTQAWFRLFGASSERMDRSREALLALTKGWDAARVQRIVRDALQEVVEPIVYAEALELLDEHRAAGRELYFVSAASIEIVRPLAQYLGVPHVLASQLGVDEEGRYDGTLAFSCYGAAKAVAIRAEAETRGLDLAASWGYSDSVTDVPMLEAVGHPVAVNPDRALRTLSAERGWEVRDFARPVAVRSRIRIPGSRCATATSAASENRLRWRSGDSRLRPMRRPPSEVVAGAGALGAAVLAGYALVSRGRSARAG